MNVYKLKNTVMKKESEEKNKVETSFPLPTYVENALREENFTFEKDVENPFYRIFISCDSIDIDIAIECCEEQSFIRVYAVPEYKVPANKRLILLPKINQLNLESSVACLRIDEEDGMLSSVLFINTDGGVTDTRILKSAISQCFNMISNNMDTLMEIIYNKRPDELMISAFEKLNENEKLVRC